MGSLTLVTGKKTKNSFKWFAKEQERLVCQPSGFQILETKSYWLSMENEPERFNCCR